MSEDKKPYGRPKRQLGPTPVPHGSQRSVTRSGQVEYCAPAPPDETWEGWVHRELVTEAMRCGSRSCGGESLPGLHMYALASSDDDKPGYELWIMGVLSRAYTHVPLRGGLALRVAIARHFDWFETTHGWAWEELQLSVRDTELGADAWEIYAHS